MHQGKEESRQQDIDADALQRIIDGVQPLAEDVRQERRRTVAGHTAPSAGHVTILRDEHDVDRDEHDAASEREPHAIDRLVDELVPQRQVEEQQAYQEQVRRQQ